VLERGILSIPLILTLSRILLGPVFVLVYSYYQELGISFVLLPYVLLALAAVSELSDVFDGALARKMNTVTDLGKLLDPMADTIFRLSVLLSFTQGVVGLPVLLVALFFYRDTVIGTLRSLCALKGVALAARPSGKIKAVIQAAVGFFIMLMMIPFSLEFIDLEQLQTLSFYAVSLSAVYTLYSGLEYILAYRQHIMKSLGFSAS